MLSPGPHACAADRREAASERREAWATSSSSAARKGLGRELAQSYADEGRDVIVTGRDQPRAETSASEIGGATRGIGFDLADPHTIEGALESVGEVDHLVLAAIERDVNSVREYKIDAALRLVTMKLVGYAEVIHVLLPQLRDDSSILIYGGLARDRPYPGSTTVTTVNGGVTSLVRTLVIELAPIRVNAIHNGIVGDSPQWREHAPRASQGTRRSYADRAPRDDVGVHECSSLPARERGGQRHQPRCRRWLDVHVSGPD